MSISDEPMASTSRVTSAPCDLCYEAIPLVLEFLGGCGLGFTVPALYAETISPAPNWRGMCDAQH